MNELDLKVGDIVECKITSSQRKSSYDTRDLMTNTCFDAKRLDRELNAWFWMPRTRLEFN